MKHFMAAIAVVGSLSVGALDARADTTKLCAQQVNYSITSPDATVPPELRMFSGVWAGNVVFQPTVEMCVGLVVEKIQANGAVDTKFVWLTGSDTGIGNIASLGTVSWSGKIDGDVLRLTGTQNGNTYTYEFKPKGRNELGGHFAENANRSPLSLSRRTNAPW